MDNIKNHQRKYEKFSSEAHDQIPKRNRKKKSRKLMEGNHQVNNVVYRCKGHYQKTHLELAEKGGRKVFININY